MKPSPALVERRMASALEAARDLFGYAGFRDEQEPIIRATLSHEHVLGVFPTGGGKSLCYQLPAIVEPGLTVVVSPLIALMEDQVNKLRNWGVAAAHMNGPMPSLKGLKLLYVAPERLKGNNLLDALKTTRVSRIVTDESHIISDWKDFRSVYVTALAKLRRTYPDAPVMALTATADHLVEMDIARVLRWRAGGYRRFISSPWRENLTYRVANDLPIREAAELIRSKLAQPGSVLVYVATRKATEEVQHMLQEEGLEAGDHYHAGLDKDVRTAKQERFMAGNTRWMVCTSAFGMGIDKGDIRMVYNHHAPPSLSAYLQMAGRGGRDGGPCTCYLNFSREGENTLKRFHQMAHPPLWVYSKLWSLIAGGTGKNGIAMWTMESLRAKVSKNEYFQGWCDVALAGLEFRERLEMLPGPRTYRLKVRDSEMARAMARRVGSNARVAGAVMTVRLDAEADDPVPDMIASGAVDPGTMEEGVAVRLLKRDHGETDDTIDLRANKSWGMYEQLKQFARAGNKRAFVEHAFLKANKGENS